MKHAVLKRRETVLTNYSALIVMCQNLPDMVATNLIETVAAKLHVSRILFSHPCK